MDNQNNLKYNNLAPLGLRIGSAVTDVPTNSKIRDTVTSVEIQMSDLHSLISTLENRLESVVAPRPPQVSQASNSPAPSGPPMSDLQTRMQSLSNTLYEAQARLQRLLSDIEV